MIRNLCAVLALFVLGACATPEQTGRLLQSAGVAAPLILGTGTLAPVGSPEFAAAPHITQLAVLRARNAKALNDKVISSAQFIEVRAIEDAAEKDIREAITDLEGGKSGSGQQKLLAASKKITEATAKLQAFKGVSK